MAYMDAINGKKEQGTVKVIHAEWRGWMKRQQAIYEMMQDFVKENQ